MTLSRRKLITGLGASFLAAPATVRASSHMAVNATFNISSVPVKSGQFGLTWTSSSADVRPTFSLENVSNPAAGDELHLFFDGVEYTTTVGYDHLYDLLVTFPELPELLNDTYPVYVEWHSGATVTTSNTVDVTIDVAYSVPVISGTPTIARAGNTFTITPTSTAGRPVPTRTYQWHRDGSPISGETGVTYEYTSPDDEGTTITCVQTETNSEGADTATSNGIAVPIDPWVPSTAQPANQDLAFASATATFTSVDFVAGLGIVMVGQGTSGRTITGVTVNGNACTQVAVSGSTHWASMWKITIATPGSYSVVVTANFAFGTVGIATGTIEGVNAAETDTATLDLATGNQPFSTTSSITVPTDGLGLAFMMSGTSTTVAWSSPAVVDKCTETHLTVSNATMLSSGTPTITSHAYGGVAMVAAAWGP